MSGLYASDGSINVTVVSGGYTGLYGTDGSWNVIPNTSGYGLVDPPTGALRVTLVSGSQNSIYAQDGSLNVSVSPYISESRYITVVSGSFGPPPTGFYYVWLGF